MKEKSTVPTDARIRRTLRDTFGHNALRPGQKDVVQRVLRRESTLAIMPTGAGKSLCYQVPALLMPGMTVIVSPLIALMRDQFDKLSGLGLEAVQVNSAIPAADIQRARGKIGRRAVEFVFTTPEQLAASDLRAWLGRAAVDLLVIDEAHCISQWGHDFRPAYLDALSRLHAFGSPTILALTATATPDVVVDIERQLGVGPLCVINTGTHRPNLSYQPGPPGICEQPGRSRAGTAHPCVDRRVIVIVIDDNVDTADTLTTSSSHWPLRQGPHTMSETDCGALRSSVPM
jgi:ATP-dependent DNA helicase RecQ